MNHENWESLTEQGLKNVKRHKKVILLSISSGKSPLVIVSNISEFQKVCLMIILRRSKFFFLHSVHTVVVCKDSENKTMIQKRIKKEKCCIRSFYILRRLGDSNGLPWLENIGKNHLFIYLFRYFFISKTLIYFVN